MDQPRIELSVLPPNSAYFDKIEAIAADLGVKIVPVDAVSPADLAERILVVDLTHSVAAVELGRRVVAVSDDLSFDRFEVVPPLEVKNRLARAIGNFAEVERLESTCGSRAGHWGSSMRLA